MAGYPGGEEGWKGARDLGDELRKRADGWGLTETKRNWVDIERATVRWLLCETTDAEAILDAALVNRPDPVSAFRMAVLAAQLHAIDRSQEGERYLEQAREAMDKVTNPVEHDDLEARWSSAKVRYLVFLGLPDRAQAPLEREQELAHQIASGGGPRLRLDDALQDEVFVHHALVEDEVVVELLRRSNPDLPASGSTADCRLVLREAWSRQALEVNGRWPADRTERDPLELVKTVLASDKLDTYDRDLARTLMIIILLDRGDADGAERALHALPTSSDSEACSAVRLADMHLLLAVRLAMLRGRAEEYARLLDEVRSSWRAYLEHWKPIARASSELAPLQLEDGRLFADALVRLHMAVEGPERGALAALEDVMAGQAVGSLAQAFGADVPAARTVCEELVGPDELALLHVPVREFGHVLAIDRTGVTVYPMGVMVDIQDARRKLSRELDRALTEDVAWDAVDRAAESLARLLLPGDLRERIARAKGLAIVAPENIGYVPFELFPGQDGKPLGESVAVRYLPSLPVGLALESRRSKRSPAPAGSEEIATLVADQPGLVRDANFAPFSVDEAGIERLLSPYPLALRELRSGSAANRAGLLDLLGHFPRVLQIVAHGNVDTSLDDPASLVLAGDDPLLRAGDVEALHAPDLVVLSACSSWSGPRRRGDDGRKHLPSAFLLAGADTVIAAERALLLEPALDFFALFHQELHAGRSPAEALAAARRTLAARSSTRRERTFSQLVHAIGLGDQPLFTPTETTTSSPTPSPMEGAANSSTRPLLLASLALAGLGVGGLFILRRRTPT